MMQLKEKHKTEISALNVTLSLLVVFIHVSSSPVTLLDKSSWQYALVFIPWRLSGFVVQGFIFLSGIKLFLNRSAVFDYRRFYIGRLIKIIIPYLLWNIIYYTYFISAGYEIFSPQTLLSYILTGTLVSPFYFIVTIVQFYALAPLWHKLVKTVAPEIALVFAAILTLFLSQYLPEILRLIFPDVQFVYNDRVFTTYLLYWVAGCYAGAHYDRLKEAVINNRQFIAAVFALFTLAEAVLSYIAFSGISIISWLENIHFLYCVSAVLFFFTFYTAVFKDHELKSRLLREIDAASYGIYLIHCLVIYIINALMSSFGITSISLSYLIRIITVYLLSIGLCILWNRRKTLLRKHK
jgi:peptidoglycan/LPS O-acetylase OafA/YrhL